jgi:hypothetical protein
MNSPHFTKTPERNILREFSISNIDNISTENEKEESNQLLKSEIKNLESSLCLYGYPSFSEILIPLSSNSQFPNIIKQTIQNLTKILRIKQRDNEIKVEYLDKINKLESEKQNLENFVSKLRIGFNESTEKLKKSEQLFSDKKKKWKEKKQKLLTEIEEITKQLGKMKLRENQFNHELKKKEILITKLNEQLKKNILTNEKGSSTSKDYLSNSSLGNFSNSSQKSEITISYVLSKNLNSTINMQNFNSNSSMNPKNYFLEEIQKNLENKYSNIIKENEKIKNFLIDFHSKFAQLTEIKKEVFLTYYKKTFGIDFPNENKLDLNPEEIFKNQNSEKNFNFCNLSSLSPSLEIEPLVDSFLSNFLKLREYLLRNEEMFYINNNFDFSKENFNKLSLKGCRDDFLSEKYVHNMMSVLESYKKINSNLISILNRMTKIKEIEKDSLLNSFISRFEVKDDEKNFETEINSQQIQYINNINEILKENDSIMKNYINEKSFEKNEYIESLENDLNKMKENERINIEKFHKFNESVKEDLKAYEKIINSTAEFCKN